MTVRGVLVCAALVACGRTAARVTLAPVDLGTCGRPARADVSSLELVAYTAHGEQPENVPLDARGAVAVSDLPADTLQLGVELDGPGGAIAIGKTVPLSFDDLPEGATISIAVLPPDGFCRVGDLTEPRRAPAVAPAGGGVLVVGGFGPSGAPLSTAEYYDSATATFAPVDVPPQLVDDANGLAGVALAPLPDGRVVLSGTASHAVAYFDPATRAISVPQLFEHRAFHAALAVDAERLFVVGGCTEVAGATCSGGALSSSFVYHLDDLEVRDAMVQLPNGAARYGAQLFELGVQRDGQARYALAGGFGDPGAGDRFALDDVTSQTITGLGAQVAALDGGALLSAYAPDGAAPTGTALQLAPDATAPVAVASAPPASGARLVALEDGSVLAVGGDPSGAAQRYVPTVNAWTALPPPVGPPGNGAAPGALDAPALERLPDGSVLVVGAGPTASSAAWLFRPSLVGPSAGLVVAEHDGSTPGVLTASDPAQASHAGGRFTLTAADDTLAARALVGGARAAEASVNAAIQVSSGGVALVGQQLGPGRALIGALVPGAPAQIARQDGGALKVLCTGRAVPAFDPMTPVSVGLAVAGTTATLSLAGAPVLTCDLSGDPDVGDAGAWGIAADGAGAALDVVTITVAR